MTVTSSNSPLVVNYCHCADCRRLSGAPVAAFAAFPEGSLQIEPGPGVPSSHTPGVVRWFCKSCGSPLAAQYDYLPSQIYVPLGLLDQAGDFPPVIHCHADAALAWLQINDSLVRQNGSGRDTLLSSDPIR